MKVLDQPLFIRRALAPPHGLKLKRQREALLATAFVLAQDETLPKWFKVKHKTILAAIKSIPSPKARDFY